MTAPAIPPPPPKPEPPEQSECCRGDCSPHCVFDVYERELERWEAEMAAWRARYGSAPAP